MPVSKKYNVYHFQIRALPENLLNRRSYTEYDTHERLIAERSSLFSSRESWEHDIEKYTTELRETEHKISNLLRELCACCGKKRPEEKPVPTEHGLAPTDLFRPGEVQLRFAGIGGVGHDEHLVTDERTVKETKTVIVTTFVPEIVEKDIPGTPGLTPEQENVPVTTTHKETVKKSVKHTRNDAAIQGGFGGLDAEAKVFVTQNIGLGLEGDWLDGGSSVGDILGTVTARFPMGSNAPYVFGGAGVQFGDHTQAVGKLGGGVEHRFSPNTGVFVDASWLFGDRENAVVFRAGVSIIN